MGGPGGTGGPGRGYGGGAAGGGYGGGYPYACQCGGVPADGGDAADAGSDASGAEGGAGEWEVPPAVVPAHVSNTPRPHGRWFRQGNRIILAL
jgi:hypothetical protein